MKIQFKINLQSHKAQLNNLNTHIVNVGILNFQSSDFKSKKKLYRVHICSKSSILKAQLENEKKISIPLGGNIEASPIYIYRYILFRKKILL